MKRKRTNKDIHTWCGSIEHRSVNQSIELSVQLKLDQFSDWLTYYYILSAHVNLSIRITFILSIKYWLYTWSKQSNQTHCQLNSQEFSKRISFFVTIERRFTSNMNVSTSSWMSSRVNCSSCICLRRESEREREIVLKLLLFCWIYREKQVVFRGFHRLERLEHDRWLLFE